MSQYPQPPYNPQQPFNPQPPYPPPYSPNPGYGMPGPKPATSGMAIASLVLALLGCVPLLTSFLAVWFGIGGIRATRNPAVGGRGLAIAGLIVGILGLLGWSATGGLLWWGYNQSAPA